MTVAFYTVEMTKKYYSSLYLAGSLESIPRCHCEEQTIRVNRTESRTIIF